MLCVLEMVLEPTLWHWAHEGLLNHAIKAITGTRPTYLAPFGFMTGRVYHAGAFEFFRKPLTPSLFYQLVDSHSSTTQVPSTR